MAHGLSVRHRHHLGRRGGQIKRSSWLHTLVESQDDEARELTPALREALFSLDAALFDAWNLGDSIVLAWTHERGQYRFLSVRHFAIIEVFEARGESATHDGFVNQILAGSKFVSPARFESMCGVLGRAAQILRVSLSNDDQPPPDLVTALVTRYGVTLVKDKAVVLLDIVGFSLRSPLEQVAMLNSISYSVNSAYGKLLSKDIRISFARTTTGDGFYIWNRASTVQANVALYKLMMLILTDNAVAQQKSKRFPVPRLRAGFHIGEHYEFYQVEALNPTTFAYIVGQATIDLARMVTQALPGQIVIGDFRIEMHEKKTGEIASYGTREFVETTAEDLDELQGLVVGQHEIERVRCYLTGAPVAGGEFRVGRYRLRDKHGLDRVVYNAKINLHRRGAQPIFLGVQHAGLHPPGAAPWCETLP